MTWNHETTLNSVPPFRLNGLKTRTNAITKAIVKKATAPDIKKPTHLFPSLNE